jgi:hypothetical protein
MATSPNDAHRLPLPAQIAINATCAKASDAAALKTHQLILGLNVPIQNASDMSVATRTASIAASTSSNPMISLHRRVMDIVISKAEERGTDALIDGTEERKRGRVSLSF